MNTCILNRACIASAIITALSIQAAGATALIYTPNNPTFGGNPSNGPNLLSDAQAQNNTKAPALTPLQQFQNNLQQAILSNLATQIRNDLFGTNGTTITPGVYTAGNYTVTVVSNGDGTLTINTYDNANGAESSFTVSPTVQ